MLLYRNKYFRHFLLQPLVTAGFVFSFSIATSAQIPDPGISAKKQQLNPFLKEAFKKPVKSNPLLTEYIKPSKHELMYWPNYPLTAAQVEARNRKYDRPIGKQIISSIAESYINYLLSGKKMPVAVAPKF